MPPGVAEQVAEQVDAPAAFAGEVEVVDAEVHLGLLTRLGLKARHGRRRGPRTQEPHALPHHGVAAGEAALPQLLQGTLDRQAGILGEQFHKDRLKRVGMKVLQAAPAAYPYRSAAREASVNR